MKPNPDILEHMATRGCKASVQVAAAMTSASQQPPTSTEMNAAIDPITIHGDPRAKSKMMRIASG